MSFLSGHLHERVQHRPVDQQPPEGGRLQDREAGGAAQEVSSPHAGEVLCRS